MIAVITDLHFGFDKNSDAFLNQTMDFIKKQFVPYLKNNNITEVFIPGDLFDNRNNLNNKILNDVYELFNNELKEFKIHIIIGNHDIYYNSTTEIHSLKFLTKFENVIVYDEPKIITIENKKIFMVPWVIDQNIIPDILKRADVIMGHFNIEGFNFNKHVISKTGISHEYFLNKCKLIISGHFHTRAIKKINNTEFIYIGSPYQMNRGDINEDRGFLILNLEDLSYEFINNEVSPRFIKYDYPEEIKDNIKNNKVDVYIKYKKEEYAPKDYEKYLNDIKKHNPFSLNHFFTVENNLPKNFDPTTFNLSSIPNIFKTYLNILKLDKKESKKVFNKFMEIHDNVK
jgi:DNA repair exonuclease SbcCD nuclease subunit